VLQLVGLVAVSLCRQMLCTQCWQSCSQH